MLCGWDAGLLVSEDGGRTWLDRTAGLPNRQIWSVAVDPDQLGRLYASPFQQPVYVSEDFGLTWKPAFFEKATAFNLTFVRLFSHSAFLGIHLFETFVLCESLEQLLFKLVFHSKLLCFALSLKSQLEIFSLLKLLFHTFSFF